MAVYVDHARLAFGRMRMSHMVADTHDELMKMARRIGVRATWLQAEGGPDEHFDVCESKRALAIEYGAIPATNEQIVETIRGKRR